MDPEDQKTATEGENIKDMAEDSEQPIKKVGQSFQVPTSGVYSNNHSGSSKPLLIILAVILLAVIGGSAYLFREKLRPGTTPTPTPDLEVPVVISTPEPTPEAIDRSEFTIRVLNGTSTSGLAASVSAKLKELGYKIERSGNATNSAFTQTVIRTKEGASGLSDQLTQDLSSDYSTTTGPTLKDSDTSDGEVIIGSK